MIAAYSQSGKTVVGLHKQHDLTKDEVILSHLSVTDFLVQEAARVEVSICHETSFCELFANLKDRIKEKNEKPHR